jgi:hypothetical protein
MKSKNSRIDIEHMCKTQQAWVDGKPIEYIQINNMDSEYEYCGYPIWNWFEYHYRVKKTPKHVWINKFRDMYGNEWVGRLHKSLSTALQTADKNPDYVETEHYIQVLDDE